MAMSEEQGLVEELLALRTSNKIIVPSEMDHDTIFSAASWNLDNLISCSFDDQFHSPAGQSFFVDDPSLQQQQQDLMMMINYDMMSFNELLMYSQFSATHPAAPTDSCTTSLDSQPNFPGLDDIGSWSEPAFVPEEFHHHHHHKLEVVEANKLAEPAGRVPPEQPVLCVGSSGLDRRGRGKRVEGQPSKNLMAERRRRKRLNDRLSMLRSIVPKISKMDRTAILGDTIDYMKELLEKIKDLNEQMEIAGTDKSKMADIFKGVRPNEVLLRNSPKFEVERRTMDTKVEICCTGKPGLLLSTVATLDALGLEIQQCVISCFSDFNMQASCSSSEESDQQGTFMSCEDIKQALFRNAGYGGQCL